LNNEHFPREFNCLPAASPIKESAMKNPSRRCLSAGLFLLLVAISLTAQTTAGARGAAPSPPPSPPAGPGPGDKQTVDAAAAERGKTTYIAECITCHGPKARGTESGVDLIRSLIVLRDRYGNELGPFLRKAHPTQSGKSGAVFTEQQIADLSHFLKQRFNETLRSSPTFRVQNVLTGNPKTGAAYFSGAGKCSSCHSPSGDLAGIGRKYDPPTLQQRFMFPQRTKPVTITVTPSSGAPISGTLVRIDDFNVSLRDAAGEYRSWKRTRDLKIERNDPYASHVELLDRISDQNMHDVVAYLESLK
jgi:cytochrome c oxidase cbb3-type subunit 3